MTLLFSFARCTWVEGVVFSCFIVVCVALIILCDNCCFYCLLGFITLDDCFLMVDLGCLIVLLVLFVFACCVFVWSEDLFRCLLVCLGLFDWCLGVLGGFAFRLCLL